MNLNFKAKKECIRWHQKKKIHVELYEEMFCAGHKNGTSDACLGDSGGGLVIYDRGQFSLVGVTSAGFGCGLYYFLYNLLNHF